MADFSAATDAYMEEIPTTLSGSALQHFSRIQQWKTVWHLGLQWLGICLAFWLCLNHFNAVTYLIAVAWVGARQHALAILLHDGSHYRLLENRWLNDWITDVFCAWPLCVSLDGFRASHWAHHRKPNSDEDPNWTGRYSKDWHLPKSRTELTILIGRDLLGLNFVQQILRIRKFGGRRFRPSKSPAGNLVARVVYYTALVVCITYLGAWQAFFMLWVVPAFTWLQMVLRLRGIAEHYGLDYDHFLRITRTTIPTWWERLFIAPGNVGYHIEHHLYPGVPFYRLPELHTALMKHPVFYSEAHITRGYLRVLKECVHSKKLIPGTFTAHGRPTHAEKNLQG